MQILKEMPKVERKGRTPKYDFDALFGNGDSPIELKKGEDFDCSVRTMRHNLYRHSEARGLKVSTVIPADSEDTITFRVIERPEAKSASKGTSKSKATAKK